MLTGLFFYPIVGNVFSLSPFLANRIGVGLSGSMLPCASLHAAGVDNQPIAQNTKKNVEFEPVMAHKMWRFLKMSYSRFCEHIRDLLLKIDGGVGSVDISRDEDKGLYSARFSDGTVITGNPVSLKLTVRWASGHQAMVAG